VANPQSAACVGLASTFHISALWYLCWTLSLCTRLCGCLWHLDVIKVPFCYLFRALCDDVQLYNRCVREFLILAHTWFAFGLPSKIECDSATSLQWGIARNRERRRGNKRAGWLVTSRGVSETFERRERHNGDSGRQRRSCGCVEEDRWARAEKTRGRGSKLRHVLSCGTSRQNSPRYRAR
jgi:hypothetical protein